MIRLYNSSMTPIRWRHSELPFRFYPEPRVKGRSILGGYTQVIVDDLYIYGLRVFRLVTS